MSPNQSLSPRGFTVNHGGAHEHHAPQLEQSDGAAPLWLFGAERGDARSAVSGPYRVVFDGWLYNREALRAELTASFEPQDDAELLLQAYLRWQDGLLGKIKGIFALAIYDARSDTLLCARDPLGTYPFFYTATTKQLLLSTSIETLLRHPQVSSELNRIALADYLLDREFELDETFFASVKRLPPGHALKVQGQKQHVYRYWHPLPQAGTIDWLSDDEAQAFPQQLMQATGRCLEEGSAGIFLSGGLDSCSIGASAKDYCEAQGLASPLALSLSFDYGSWHEKTIQTEVARGLGFRQVWTPFEGAIGQEGMLQTSLREGNSRSMPLLNCFGPAFYALAAKGKAQGCDVILTGDGGDEWFQNNPWVATDLLRAGDYKRLRQLFASHDVAGQPAGLQKHAKMLWSYGLRPTLRTTKHRFLYTFAPQKIRTRNLEKLTKRLPAWLLPDPDLRQAFMARSLARLERYQRSPGGDYQRWVQQVLDHPVNALEREQAFEDGRRLGLRWRSPFWDADLISFMLRVPLHLRSNSGKSKVLLRQILHPRFSHLGFDQQSKSDHGDFLEPAMLREARNVWPQLAGFEGLGELGVIDKKLMNQKVMGMLSQDHLAGMEPFLLWITLSTESWVRSRLVL